MKKVIRITENDITRLVKRVLSEQEEQVVTNYDKTYDYKRVGDEYFFKRKESDSWKKASGKGLEAISSKVFKNKEKQPSSVVDIKPKQQLKPVSDIEKVEVKTNCPVISKNSDIADLRDIVSYWSKKHPNLDVYKFINNLMGNYVKSYIKEGISERISCEAALIKVRPNYNDKNSIIIDSLQKLIYIFDKYGKFIGKSEIISGSDKQSMDPKVIAQSLLTWDEQANKLGFTWIDGQGYKDKTNAKRKYSDDLIYKGIESNKTRFLPKGIFRTGERVLSNKEYAGGDNNVLDLLDKNNKILGQAIHGYYLEQPRTEALKKARAVLSNPNDPKISKDFIDLVSSNKVNLSQSSGCINVPTNFVPYIKKYMMDAYVFNIGEDKNNYLASNGENYINKLTGTEACQSPTSMGAVPLDNIA